MRNLCLILAGIIMSNLAVCQQVTNIRADMQGDVVNIHYDLLGNTSSEQYRIELYASHNNYSQPLQQTSGDVGENITPGSDKLISWRPTDELQDFQGDIIFEVRATLMGSYFRFVSPVSSDKIKKGKTINIRWEGGNNSDKVKVELLQLNKTVSTLNDEMSNNGRLFWTVPKSMKPGKGFRIRVTSTTIPTNTGISPTFSISGGIPVFVLVGVPVVIGSTIAAILLFKKPPIEPPVKDNLPDPPASP